MDTCVVGPARLRRSNTYSASVAVAPRVETAALDDIAARSSTAALRLPQILTPRKSVVRTAPTAPEFKLKVHNQPLAYVYDSDDAEDNQRPNNQRESHETEEHDARFDTDVETDDSQPPTPPESFTPSIESVMMASTTTTTTKRKVTIFETPAQAEASSQRRERRLPTRRNSADARHLAVLAHGHSTSSSTSDNHSHHNHPNLTGTKLSAAQKRGCFKYIKRRHSTAMAFASMGNDSMASVGGNNANWSDDALSGEQLGSHWEYVKTKHGVEIFKSTRSRCEIRGVTRVNASVKNVMSLLAAGESTESFAHAQNMLLGRDQVLEARVLASCVPSSASRYFHCGLKYMAIKNPFGLNPLDLVFLDYTDVSTTPDDKLIGYRILESIRVPEFRSVSKYTRASIRCEVYIVRETEVPGVVEVSFASHMDPKSKYFASKRHTWLDQIVVRLTNLRSYAEKASFSHRLLLEKGKLVRSETRHHCFICETGFSFLRKRHNCRLCGEVTCGRCSHKLPVFVGTETTRVRVCLGCMIESRRQPDELGRLEVLQSRRNSIGNSTYIAYDEIEDVSDNEHDM